LVSLLAFVPIAIQSSSMIISLELFMDCTKLTSYNYNPILVTDGAHTRISEIVI